MKLLVCRTQSSTTHESLTASIALAASLDSRSQFVTDGTKPTIDLNLVHNPSADYQVTSTSNDNYKYHVNPCGQVSERVNTSTPDHLRARKLMRECSRSSKAAR